MNHSLPSQVLSGNPDDALAIAFEPRRNEHSVDPAAEVRDVQRTLCKADGRVGAAQLVQQQIPFAESSMSANAP